jgi:hypothetical protein
LMYTSLSLHFIDVQCLDMFRALLAHPQEAVHERRIGDYCGRPVNLLYHTVC